MLNTEYSTNIFTIRSEVIECLLDKKRNKATELIANGFSKNNYIYSIRDDRISEIWVYKEGVYVPDGMTYIKQFCRMILDPGYTTSLTNNVISKIEVDTYIDKDKFFIINDVYEIPLLNGILNIKTKKLDTFTPNKIFFNKIPVTYNPDKNIDKIKTFFEDILEKEDILIIQELFGFVLVKKYFAAKAFMFLGSGANGKSKLLELLKRFVGAENCSGVSLDEMQSSEFASSEMFNKMINIAGDLSSKSLMNTSTFKQVTGGDRIGANRKFMKPIYFENYAKLINACNELPKTRDISDGFFRRWIMIKFNNIFLLKHEYDNLNEEDKDKFKLANENIIEDITTDDEMSGLLNWALEGLNRLLQQKGFSQSKTTKEIKSQWLRTSNSFEAFFLDKLEIDPKCNVDKNEIREEYAQYCKDNDLKIETDFVIKNTLINKGAWEKKMYMIDEEGKKRRKNVWGGIWIKSKVKENFQIEEDEVVD